MEENMQEDMQKNMQIGGMPGGFDTIQMSPAPKARKGISGSTIKLIAIISMFIDHLGATILGRMLVLRGMGNLNASDLNGTMQWLMNNAVLYYSYTAMRMIGRLGFPIFCFLLIEGFGHTRNVKKYAFRLFLFSLISEIPFDLAFSGKILEFGHQNVFFTLLIGLLTMMTYRWIEEAEWKKWLKIICYAIALGVGMGVAELMQTDYAAIGVLCIMVLYIFRNNKKYQIIAGCIAFLWEVTAPLAFIPIGFYNGKRGWNIKYFFYAFYPVHLLLLYIICYFMGMGSISVM